MPLPNLINIHPLDLNANVAIGVVFPLMNEGTFEQSFTTKEQVKTNILNVLLTEKGERVYMPNFGVGLKQILFENAVNSAELRDRISNQLSFYVPEIAVEEVIAEQNEHILRIILSYRIIVSQEQDTIQVNINNGPSDGIDLNNSATGF